MPIKNIYIPNLGESIEEVTFSKWLVKNNSYVTADQPICEIETDKATQELSAEFSGLLIHQVSEGCEIKIGALIANIEIDIKNPKSSLTEKQRDAITDSLGTLISDSIVEDKIFTNIVEDLRINLTEYYSNIIEYLNNTIQKQIILINNQKTKIDKYEIQHRKMLAFRDNLRADFNIEFETEKIDTLSLLILEQFKKIELFDLYIKSKKSLLEKWMSMIAEGMTSETIVEIIEYSKENNHKNILKEITSISNNWNSLKKKENSGIVDFEYSDKVRNKISIAIISLLHEFEEQIS